MENNHEFIKSLVQEAGEFLMKSHGKTVAIEHKNNDWRDEVTSVDREVSAFLIGKIKEKFPEHQIHSEEVISTESTHTSRYTWTIDPIDGTSNFARDIPHFACCVALLDQGVPIVGAVYNPITDELFSFAEGKGAFLNGNPMHVSGITEPSRAQGILIVGHQPPLWDWGTAVYRSFLEHLKKLKGFGSSSLDLCFLAAGRADIVVYGTLTTQDIASAIGIVRAAGGEVYTIDGVPVQFSATRQTVVVTATKELFENARAHLHAELLPR